MIIHDVKQGSGEWLALRCGKLSGTRLSRIIGAQAKDLITELIAELGSGEVAETRLTPAMLRGLDLEPYVIKLWSKIHGEELIKYGLWQSEEFPFLVCSPDGVTKDNKTAVEVKCPNTKTHVKYILDRQIDKEYIFQIYNYFLVNPSIEKVFFVSFDDRYRPMPYFEILYKRVDLAETLSQLKETIKNFWDELTILNNKIIHYGLD